MRRGNPEAEATLDRRLPFTSLPVLVKEQFLPGKRPAVIGGTHGKTTTSSMLAHILLSTGRDPSWLIGGIPFGDGDPSRPGSGPDFVLEGDEYDTAFFDKGPKLMHYVPDVAVLNAVEMDHADIYKDLQTVQLQFRRWVNIIPRRSLLLVNGDDAIAVETASKALSRVETFGQDARCDWRIEDLVEGPEGTTFRLKPREREDRLFPVRLPTVGAFNARNAVAAIVAAAELGVPLVDACATMAGFPGVKRRLEIRGEVAGVVVVDDFAHHPTAIRETIRASRARWPGRRLIAILEPRSWSLRRNVFQDALPEALAGADRVVIAAVYRADLLPEAERLDIERLVSDLRGLHVAASSGDDAAGIVESLAKELRNGDVVLVMSNGGFDAIHVRLLTVLQARDVGRS